jgi:hypothetical protein
MVWDSAAGSGNKGVLRRSTDLISGIDLTMAGSKKKR